MLISMKTDKNSRHDYRHEQPCKQDLNGKDVMQIKFIQRIEPMLYSTDSKPKRDQLAPVENSMPINYLTNL